MDDDRNSAEIIKLHLEKDHNVDVAINGVHAIDFINQISYDIIISDLVMNDVDGFEVMSHVKRNSPGTFFILITAFGTGDIAIKAIQEGAYEYISKPFKMRKLRDILSKVEKRINEQRKINGKDVEEKPSGLKMQMVANSQSALEMLKSMARIATSEAPVLITGESGTGKEIMANAIHEYSRRKNECFVPVNCNAIPSSLLESELFGYEKGAFTGAEKLKKGYFEQAQNGTLFLDEVGDLELDLQVKLLRVLQENQVRRVGGARDINLNIRYIFATNVNLEKKLQDESFRVDLYYRLKVTELRLPPLRDRKEDILDLSKIFIEKYTDDKINIALSDEAAKLLLRYNFPGNIRELENIIRSATILAKDTGVIMPYDLDIELKSTYQSSRSLSQQDIHDALENAGFKKNKAAELLGVSRATLYRLLDKYKIQT